MATTPTTPRSLSHQRLIAGDGGKHFTVGSPLKTQLTRRLPLPPLARPRRLWQLFTFTNHTWLLMVRKPLRFITASSFPIVLDSCCRLTSHHGFLETNGECGSAEAGGCGEAGLHPKSSSNQPQNSNSAINHSKNSRFICHAVGTCSRYGMRTLHKCCGPFGG